MRGENLKYLLALLLLIPLFMRAQQGERVAMTQIAGMVRDSLSGDAIPFASVQLQGTSEGLMANSKGGFNINSRESFSALRVTAVGYREKLVPITQGHGSVVIVELSPSDASILGELVVRKKQKEKYSKKNNPAVKLARELYEHRDEGNPLNMPYFHYRSYEKLMYGLSNMNDLEMGDDKALWVKEYTDTSQLSGHRFLPFSVKEMLADDYYQHSPKKHRSVVDGDKTKGIDDNMDQKVIRTYMKELLREPDIFGNEVPLMSNHFISPLADIATNFYKFYIIDTVEVDDEPCVMLGFVPFNPESMGFVGHLYVATSDHFINRVKLNVPSDINLNYVQQLCVDQHFVRGPENTRLKMDDDVEVILQVVSGTPAIFFRRTTNFFRHDFEDTEKQLFSVNKEEIIAPGAYSRDSVFWAENRADMAAQRHVRAVTKFTDKMSGRLPYRIAQCLMNFIITPYIPTGKPSYFNISPIRTMLAYNSLEGLRFRVGGTTTVALNKRLFGWGHVAYGCRDKKMKYRVGVEYSFEDKERYEREFPIHSIMAWHEYDVYGIAQNTDFFQPEEIFSLWKRQRDVRKQYIRTTGVAYEREWANHFSFRLKWEHQVHEATPYVPYIYNDGSYRKRYTESAFTLSLRYAPGEQFYQMNRNRIAANHDAWVFMLSHTFAPKGFLGSLYELNMTQLGVKKRLWLSAFGYADMSLTASKIWSKVAYPDLLYPTSNISYFITPGAFNLTNVMEFATDQNVAWQLTYWGNGVVFNRIPFFNRLRLREVFDFHGIWGSLSDKNDPRKSDGLFAFPDDVLCQSLGSKPYMEISAGIDNILSFLRIDYVWRLTYRHTPDAHRGGLRFQIHLTF